MIENRYRTSHIEALELRRLLAASVDGSGILQVSGTEANDSIVVSAVGANTQVVVNGGAAQSFATSSIKGANIQALGGNDVIIITTALPLCAVFGGAGNDKIAGGDGNETLNGNAGKDQIDGGLGNDKLNGNGGNDKLFGGAGGDRLYGGAGNDYLDGGSSGDKLYGQAGMDTMLGQSGDDNLQAYDTEVDQVFGGTGADSGIVDSKDVRGSIEQIAVI